MPHTCWCSSIAPVATRAARRRSLDPHLFRLSTPRGPVSSASFPSSILCLPSPRCCRLLALPRLHALSLAPPSPHLDPPSSPPPLPPRLASPRRLCSLQSRRMHPSLFSVRRSSSRGRCLRLGRRRQPPATRHRLTVPLARQTPSGAGRPPPPGLRVPPLGVRSAPPVCVHMIWSLPTCCPSSPSTLLYQPRAAAEGPAAYGRRDASRRV